MSEYWYNKHYKDKETKDFLVWHDGRFGKSEQYEDRPGEADEYFTRKGLMLFAWLTARAVSLADETHSKNTELSELMDEEIQVLKVLATKAIKPAYCLRNFQNEMKGMARVKCFHCKKLLKTDDSGNYIGFRCEKCKGITFYGSNS